MLKSPVVWIAALWVGVMIHLDWHFGRPGHDHRSFNLTYHWLTALPTCVSLAWLALRRWPHSALSAGGLILGLGILLGQGLEPLGEVILFREGWEPFTDPVRWRIFAEFLAAGLISLLVGVAGIPRMGPSG
jgi:hypothetical protein